MAVALLLGSRPDGSATPEERVERVAAGLRCPVCQGLSVADSDAETARQIRADIAGRITDGQSDAEIRQAYVDRYGQWVLLRPSGQGFGALVWFVPAIATAGAATALVMVGRRWRRGWSRTATESDVRLVREALRDVAGDAP